MRSPPWICLLTVVWAGSVRARETPRPWQLTLSPAKSGAVFDVAEDPHVRAVVRNTDGQDQEASLKFEVADYDGHVLGAGNVPIVVPQGQARSVDVRLGEAAKLPHGEYLAVKVVLTADGRPRAEIRKGFGFLPKRGVTTPPGQSPFGLLAEGSWPLLPRLGARCVRPNWNWDERPMEWARRYGVAYCPLINAANAFVQEEITEKEYADFVGQSVGRFKGYVKHWQLGNEFDVFHRDGPKSYVACQRIGYAAAKAADPDCLVIGGSITELQVRKEGWREALQLGLADHCDVYDFHFYVDLETTGKLLDYIHAACKEFGAQKPIWVTETAQVGMFDPEDRNQAEYVFKRYAHLMSGGVSAIFWHVLRWPYPFSADKTQATALIDHEGFARPALFAYAAMTRELTDARFARRWDIGQGVYALEFSRPKRARLVLWSEGPGREVRLRHPPGEAYATHISGKRSTLPATNGPTTVAVGKAPVIYDLPGPVAALD